MDNLKTKLMIDPSTSEGFIDCNSKIMHQNGLNSMLNGSGVRITYLMHFSIAHLLLYEILKNKLETVPSPSLDTKDAKYSRSGTRSDSILP